MSPTHRTVPPTDLRPLRNRQAGQLPFAPRSYNAGRASVDLPEQVRGEALFALGFTAGAALAVVAVLVAVAVSR